MAQVTVRINGYSYPIGCDDGQESHLQAMAADVDARIAGIKAVGGQSGEAKLLMLAALLMADELHDLRAAPPSTPAPRTRRLSRIAEKAEEIAAQVEQGS